MHAQVVVGRATVVESGEKRPVFRGCKNVHRRETLEIRCSKLEHSLKKACFRS